MSYAAPKGGFRTFLVLWSSQSVSVFGTALTLFALNIWLVESVYPLPEQRPQLAWALAAFGLINAGATMLTTPLAGALADRLDRKRLMLVTDLLQGLVMSGLAWLMGSGRADVWIMLIAAAFFGIAGAIHGSAFDTSYAMLVPDDQLPRANGMMQSMWALSGILSPALAATIIALPAMARQGLIGGGLGAFLAPFENGAALAFGVDAVTFFLAAAVLAFLAIPSPKRRDLGRHGGEKSSIWADIRFGATYVWRRKPLLWLLSTYAVVNLCTSLGVFLPLVVKVDLAADWAVRGFTYETALAALNSAMAFGGLTGGVLVSLWGGLKRNKVLLLLGSILMGGTMQIATGLSSGIYMAIVAGFLMHFTVPVGNAHSQAIWQGQVPREMQGRVFAVRRVLAQGLVPLGTVLAGWLAGVMDPGMGLALLGGVVALVAGVQLFNPVLRRVEDKDYLDSMADRAAEAAGSAE